MKRIVPDTNQACLLEAWSCRPMVALPPCVLAELFLYKDFQTAHTFGTGNMLLGLEPVHVMDEISRLGLEQIPDFEPFFRTGIENEEAYLLLARGLYRPAAVHREWARTEKSDNLSYCAWLEDKAKKIRGNLKELLAKEGEFRLRKYRSMKEVLDDLCSSSESLLNDLVFDTFFRRKGRHESCHEKEALIEAVLANPYLRRYFHTILCYLVSTCRLWHHDFKHLNFDPSASRDDRTDITISLYVAPGDIVLSADRKLRDLFSMVDDLNEIKIMTAEEVRMECGGA